MESTSENITSTDPLVFSEDFPQNHNHDNDNTSQEALVTTQIVNEEANRVFEKLMGRDTIKSEKNSKRIKEEREDAESEENKEEEETMFMV